MQVMTSQDELAREIVELFPEQGRWSEEEYLWVTDRATKLIEYTDGYIEVLPVPTEEHQDILQYLFLAFLDAVRPRGGKVHFAPLRLRIRDHKYREPDLLVLLDADDPRRNNRYWFGADLVLEVVSDDKPERDLVDKVRDYAEARIPEYWIVNPLAESITVLRLADDRYSEHGTFGRGDQATSALMPDFGVDVSAALDAR
jgi:Uma2 family endonuclease